MTDAELAILALLSEKPTYDHELNRLIDQRGLRRWTAIGSSSMYYVLDKLEKQGLITMLSEKDGKRLFQISPAGTGVLQTSVADLLSTTRTHDRSFELGIANISVLRSSQVFAALVSRQHELTVMVERLTEQIELERQNGTFISVSLFSHRLTIMKAELDWLDHFIDAWKAQAPPDPEVQIEPAIIPRSRQVVLPQDPDSIHKHSTREIPPFAKHTPVGMRTEIRINTTPPSPDEPEDPESLDPGDKPTSKIAIPIPRPGGSQPPVVPNPIAQAEPAERVETKPHIEPETKPNPAPNTPASAGQTDILNKPRRKIDFGEDRQPEHTDDDTSQN